MIRSGNALPRRRNVPTRRAPRSSGSGSAPGTVSRARTVSRAFTVRQPPTRRGRVRTGFPSSRSGPTSFRSQSNRENVISAWRRSIGRARGGYLTRYRQPQQFPMAFNSIPYQGPMRAASPAGAVLFAPTATLSATARSRPPTDSSSAVSAAGTTTNRRHGTLVPCILDKISPCKNRARRVNARSASSAPFSTVRTSVRSAQALVSPARSERSVWLLLLLLF